MKICLLATGPSMSQAIADSVRGNIVIAINNAYQLAPWADALCAQDHEWWRVHSDAKSFAGRKFSTNRVIGVEQVFSDYVQRQSSSGVLALEVARRYGAQHKVWEIELHGFDNRGTHYFGPHPEPLRNTSVDRFRFFENQLAALGGEMSKGGFRITNCTPGSALTCFRMAA
jgi:hypothetical protein